MPATKARKKAAPAAEKVLVLRTCDADRRSYGGFQWPAEGPVAAPDWKPTPECGSGLHGLLWGEGDGGLLRWDPEALWLVVEVEAAEIVDLAGKVKFPAGVVVFCGSRLEATQYLSEHGGAGRAIVGGTATAGDGGTIQVRSWDYEAQRYRTVTGYVGEDDIEAGVAYKVEGRRLVRVAAAMEEVAP